MNIEKILNPKNGKLIKKGNIVTATILDEELDELNLSFDYSATVKIDTENIRYICLGIGNLLNMIKLIEDSEAYYKIKFNKKYGKN